MQTDTAKPTLMERIREHRVALTATAVPLMTVGAASAAVNFTPIEELITAVTGLIPSFLDLVVALAPLIVTISVIAFVVKFWDKIIGWMNF